MPINFAGKIGKKDYKQVIKLSMKFLTAWKVLMFLVLIPVSCVFIDTLSNSVSSITTLIPFFIFGLLVFTMPWWYANMITASYSKAGNIYSKPVHGRIEETSIFIANEVTHLTTQWNAFTHYKMGKDIVLLYTGKTCANIFPAHLFSTDTDWQKFLEQIEARLPRK